MGPRKLFWAALLSASMLTACGDDAVVCGAGTLERNGSCVADPDLGGGAGQPTAGSSGSSGSGGGGGDAGGLQCGDGTQVVNGECVLIDGGGGEMPEPAPKAVGASCTANDECETGTCAQTEMLPGGYCTVLGCSADNPCPVGSTCYASATGVRLCMAFCEGDVDCRAGDDYNCQPLYTNALGICAPSCALTGACSSGTRCNEDTGLCELTNCDPQGAGDGCAEDETCWPDTRGLSQDGGLCLRLCDPAEADATCFENREVCQPLAADPANTGFCAPPVCSATHECPAGALCQDDVCQPPALCDGETACEDGLTCVSGKCMSECPTDGDESCADIHPDLVCADVLDVPACLPLGTFPGSACRPNRDDACSDLSTGGGTASMVCQDDVCLVDCTTGGSDLCQGVSDTLVCATGIFETPLCLPRGAFPGGPCGDGDTCAQDLQGNPEVDMVCLSGTCVIDCDESQKWPGYGDAMCEIVDPSLTCSETAGNVCVRACEAGGCSAGYSCFDAGAIPSAENACLPDGSFPGSACRETAGNECDQDLGGNAAVDMVCTDTGVCVIDCTTGGDGLCGAVDASLTCSETAGDICVLSCVAGVCGEGFSCFDQGGENACLPNGTFPGSACRTSGQACDQNLGGNDAVDMICTDTDVCVIDCTTGGDTLCGAVDASLTCSESAGDICVVSCATDPCPGGYSCLSFAGENACLPTGSFPSSPCRDTPGDECDQNVRGNDDFDMECTVVNLCAIRCDGDDEALCQSFDSTWTCSTLAGEVCVIACDEGACPSGYSCYALENACFPS